MADEKLEGQEEMAPEIYKKEGFWKTVVKAAAESKPGVWIKNHKKGFKIAGVIAAIAGGYKLAGDFKDHKGLFTQKDWTGDPGTIEDYDPSFSERVQDISWPSTEESVEE